MDILTVLVERAGAVVTKGELLARVWPDMVIDEANLKVNVGALRRVLGDGSRYIATVPSRGYRFVVPVEVLESDAIDVEPALAATPRADLPASTEHIFGRAEAIAGVRRALAVSRLVTIVGDGGVGKTVVAIAAARASAEERGDGAAFVDLTKILDAQFVPVAIASALGLVAAGADPLASLVHALKQRRTIVVFDNCEHLLPAVAHAIDRLVQSTIELRILATSREPLQIRGENLQRLDGLSCDSGGEACASPAFALFAARASERARYDLTDADAQAVVEICRRLDGNPLAIELAATQTAAFLPARILALLHDRFALLRFGPHEAPPRQQTLLATLDWSFSLLAPHEATLLHAMSVFAGVFQSDAAAAVANRPVDEVAAMLSPLAAKSLLVTEGAGYRFLETTRAYCVERLRLSGKDRTVRRHHAEHVCALLERAASEWAHLPAREWGARYGGVLDDLRAALGWAGREPEERSLLIRLSLAGSLLWNHFSLTEECRRYVARAVAELAAAGLAGTAVEMRLQTSLAGAIMFTEGPTLAAREAAEGALAIAVRIGDTSHRLLNLRLLAGYETFTGRHVDAMRRLETFLSIASVEDPSASLDGETMLALGELYVGRLESAAQRLEPRFRYDARDDEGTGFARFQFALNGEFGIVLGKAKWLLGFPDTAALIADAIVVQALQTEHSASLGNALAVTACLVALWRGSHEDLTRYLDLLDDRLARHGIATWRPVATYYRGALRCAQDHTSLEGVDLLERAVAELDAANHRVRVPHYLGTLADALTKCGRLARAATTLEAALQRAHTQNEQWCIPELLRIRAGLLHAQGHFDEAEALLVRSMAEARTIGALSWRLRAANDLATLWRSRSRQHDARRMLSPIYREFSEGLATRDLTVAAGLLEAD